MAKSISQADVKIIIPDDGTQVTLILPQSFGKNEMARQICHAKLRDAKVEITESVVKAVDQLIEQSKNVAPTPGSEPIRGVVARAQLPVDGVDGKVEWKLDLNPKQPEPKPQAQDEDEEQTPDGKRNFYEDSIYTTVATGTVVGILYEPTPGTDGRDVYGKTLVGKDGKPYDLQFDETIMRNAKGELITQEDGVLVKSNYAICVRKVIEVHGFVDFSTGNIDFTGDVNVAEGVRDNFIIKADGIVTVNGLVEAANIITGKDFNARGGMAGREQGTVNIGNDLNAKYLDAVSGTIKGDLKVDREIINCDLTVIGSVDSPSGLIIGGKLVIGGKVNVDIIGSDANVRSDLVIGSVPTLDPILKNLEVFMSDLEEKRKKYAEEQDIINRAGKRLTAEMKERQTEVMFELMNIDTPLNKAKDAHFRVNARAEELRTIDVNVRKTLYAGTVLTIMGVTYKLRNDARGPVEIFKDEKNEICIKRADGKVKLLASICDILS
ncbi:MAG: DUF342 domain-containing protein [Phycisphaeraceae bacterium JB051]